MKLTRFALGSVGVASAWLAFACSADTADQTSRTDATTRSLLDDQAIVVGPATPLSSDASVGELMARATRIDLLELGYNRGSVEAPLKLIEFSDFGCGFCRRFHQQTFGALESEFIETGRVEWKFLPFITGMFEGSLAVTEAAECVLEQDAARFEALSDLLWERQSEWKSSARPEVLARRWAEELGADLERFDSCLAEDRRIERIAGATVTAQQLGIRGTPTFWIVGYGPLQGALPLEVFRGILGTVVAEVEARRDSLAAVASPRSPGPI
jgi:protein-disulfide isomerase